MFADDTTLSTHTNSLDVVITSLTNDVLHVDRWCQRNHMSINTDRSNVMFISSSRNRQILQSNTEITYHDSIIKSCSTAKILGVTDNNSLSWNDHIKMHYISLYFITIKLYLSTDNRKRFYNAYFLSHFDLCCVVMWRKCTSSTMFSDIKWLSFYQTGYIYESYSNGSNLAKFVC